MSRKFEVTMRYKGTTKMILSSTGIAKVKVQRKYRNYTRRFVEAAMLIMEEKQYSMTMRSKIKVYEIRNLFKISLQNASHSVCETYEITLSGPLSLKRVPSVSSSFRTTGEYVA